MTEVVIMAGGRGMRLHPLTDHIPKPMVGIVGHPLLEELIDRFVVQGFKEFTLCVCYKADLIMDYFGDGGSRDIRINYVLEREPLGTAGALRRLPVITDPFIVMNADIVTHFSAKDLVKEHIGSRMPMTVALALYQHQVEFGVAEVDRRCITGLREKPIESWLVAAGIYCLSPPVIDMIPIDGAFAMSDLIERMVDEGVNTYELPFHWQDVGTWEALEKANSE